MRSTSSRGSNGLAKIIVGALLEPVDAVFGLGHRGQQQHRHAGSSRRRSRVRSSPFSPGIITSSTRRSKAKLASLARASAASAAVGDAETRYPTDSGAAARAAAHRRRRPGDGVRDRSCRADHTPSRRLPLAARRIVEAAAVGAVGDDAEQHLAEAVDRAARRPGDRPRRRGRAAAPRAARSSARPSAVSSSRRWRRSCAPGRWAMKPCCTSWPSTRLRLCLVMRRMPSSSLTVICGWRPTKWMTR